MICLMEEDLATKNTERLMFYGVILTGLAFLVAGLVVGYIGYHTKDQIIEDLVAENLTVQDPRILLTYETGRAPEGVEVPMVTINNAELADAQARLIRLHTLISTDGLTYSQMGREDPNRQLYLTSLTLQVPLHMAQMGLELSTFVIGVAVAFIGAGLAILFLGVPIVRKTLAIK
jgi:hypothetical protein